MTRVSARSSVYYPRAYARGSPSGVISIDNLSPADTGTTSTGSDMLPSSGLRTALSMVLLLHLFALFVAVASNIGSVSELRFGLRNVPGMVPYLQMLHMDLGYNYHLTYDRSLDYHHYAQIELDPKSQPQGPKSRSEEQTRLLELPGSFGEPGIRRQRYFNLNRTMASLAARGKNLSDDNMAALLPRAVARTLLAENEIDSGIHRFRCRYHMARSPRAVASVDPEESDPNNPRLFGTQYEANLIVSRGEVDIVRVDNAAQTAPLKKVPRKER